VLFIMGSLAVVPHGYAVTRAHMMALVFCGLLMLMAARLSGSSSPRVLVWPIVAILGVWAVSTMASVDQERSLARSAHVPIFALVFPAMQVAGWQRTSLRLVLAMGATVSLLMVLDLVMARFIGHALFTGVTLDPSKGSLGNRNDVAACLILLPTAWALLPVRFRTASWIGVGMLHTPAWMFTSSRQAMLAWLIVMLVPLTIRRPPWKSMLACGCVFVALVVGILASGTIRDRITLTLETGLGERAPIGAFGVWQWWQRPVLGNGPAIFGELYAAGVAQGWTWRGEPLLPVGMPWPHSLPVEVLCDFGLVGMATFSLVLVVAAARLRRGFIQPDFNRDLAVTSTTMLVTTLLVGLVDLSLIKDWVRVVATMALALAFMAGATKSPPVAGSSPPHGKKQASISGLKI